MRAAPCSRSGWPPAAPSTARSPCAFVSTARITSALQGIRSPRRCSPTACASSARSFKYHRPRGMLSAGCEEPNALVELRTGARREPNTRATIAELYEGLEAASQNRWPSLAFDLLSVSAPLSPLLRAGFYYKTFMWPASFWEKLYEPLIRRAAGLGSAAADEDPDHYEKAIAFCDVLVIGGGPAGLSAALGGRHAPARASSCATRTFASAGAFWPSGARSTAAAPRSGCDASIAELESLPEVRVMRRTTVFGVYDHGTYRRARARQRSHARSAAASSRGSAPGASWPSARFSPPARSSGRSSSAATTGRASCSRARCGPTSTASASRRGAGPPSSPRR